jgi:DNA processing protein
MKHESVQRTKLGNESDMSDILAAPVSELLDVLNDVERKHAPEILYYRGDPSLFQKSPRVAIVGSRHPSPDGLRRAAKLGRSLVSHGAVIVSGLAEGIDTAAHLAAIESGGRTIAVLGTPLDKPYPASNRDLFERIAADNLIVSQFAPGASVQPRNFPIRNRTMALIAHATIIVEAGEKSGTLHQAWEALRLGRPLFLLESITKRSDLQWPTEVTKYGAQVLSDATFEDLVEQLPAGHYEKAVAF